MKKLAEDLNGKLYEKGVIINGVKIGVSQKILDLLRKRGIYLKYVESLKIEANKQKSAREKENILDMQITGKVKDDFSVFG